MLWLSIVGDTVGRFAAEIGLRPILPPLCEEITMQSFTFYTRISEGSASLSETVELLPELVISNHRSQARHAKARE